jgi:LPXTG-motif cell wall-anchored protein
MRIQNENAGSSSLGKRLLTLSVAALTTAAAFLVAVPGAQAVEPSAEDNFRTDFIEGRGSERKLDLTKYLSNEKGKSATGSISDAPKGLEVGPGVLFRLVEITPVNGTDPGSMNANDPRTYVESKNDYFGVTDGQGKIVNGTGTGAGFWKANTFGPRITLNDANNDRTRGIEDFGFRGYVYYLLTEMESPWDSKGYEKAAPSIISLPFATTMTVGGKEQSGYIYNLHVFPKNVKEQNLSKRVANVNGKEYDATKQIITSNDMVTWEIVEKVEMGAKQSKDGKLYAEDVLTARGEFLVISDRLPESMQLDRGNQDVKISLRYKDGGTEVSEILPTKVTVDTKIPNKVDPPTDPLFKGVENPRIKYATARINNSDLSAKALFDLRGGKITNPAFVMSITTRVTAFGDDTGSKEGALTNGAASNHVNHKNPSNDPNNPGDTEETQSSVPSFGYQFGKAIHKKDEKGVQQPLAGAKFVLEDPQNPGSYFTSNGTWVNNPNDTRAVRAYSNEKGQVTFVGLPILKDDRRGGAGKFRLREISAPSGYQTPSAGWADVDFSSFIGMKDEEILKQFPKGVTPTSRPSFGKFAAENANILNGEGKQFPNEEVLTNFSDGEDAPVNLPLTGGKGILLMLVAGLAIMGAVLFARNRKNAAAIRRI